MQYHVMRQHLGDRLYRRGEIRDARPSEVAHLVDAGVLAEKVAPKVKNKAAPAVTNKASK